MKKIIVLVLMIMATAVCSILIYSGLMEESEINENIVYEKITSSVLKEVRELIVHLPYNYDTSKTYPVMYVLDGGSEDRRITEKINILSYAGYCPETIVVGIPNMTAENRKKNLTPPFLKTDVEVLDSPLGEADLFLTFLEEEMIPFIEKKYATSKDRMISGNSRGGLLVMYSLIKRPQLFQARFCYSTPFWRQDNIMVSKVVEALSAHDTLTTFLFMSAGEAETENIRGGLTKMTQAFARANVQGFTWHSELTPKAVHATNSGISASAAIARWGEYLKNFH